jgi:hypothetical protein
MRLLLVAVAIIILFLMIWSPKTGYVPDKAGSGGLSPNGGMRKVSLNASLNASLNELSNRNVSYNNYDVDIYDNHMIPERMVWGIGHWSKW